MLAVLSFPGAAVAKAAVAPSVRVEAVTTCQPKISDPGTRACHAQLWIYDRWHGQFGARTLALELDGVDDIRWSQLPTIELGPQTVTRTLDFELVKGQAALLRSTDGENTWTLWQRELPAVACPKPAASSTVILTQPLHTPLRAKGWSLGARSARPQTGVDFAAAGPTGLTIQSILVRSDNVAQCASQSGLLHIEPQIDDPYVQVLAGDLQILVSLPLATIP